MTYQQYRNCAACGLAANDKFVVVGSVVEGVCYVRCPGCFTIQLNPLPEVESNVAFESDATARQMADTDDRRLSYLRRRLELLPGPASRASREKPRLLDVGCSAGRLMGIARSSGWETAGIEMAPALAAEARLHNPGVTILEGDVMQTDIAGLGLFDAVVGLDVIEHVLDPERFLLKLRKVLRRDGELLLHTPNSLSLRARMHGGRWNMLIREYHFHLFSPDGMKRLLQRAGFLVTHISTASGSGTETGVGEVAAKARELALSRFALGNAMVVVARVDGS